MLLKRDYKIYLLDDDMFYRNIFQQHLINLGYSDVSNFSGPEACFDNVHPLPHIIFYDYGPDFLKGLEMLKSVKRHHPDIYLIFTCGSDHEKTVAQSLKYGAFDYFVKGDDDVKNIDSVLTKICRIRELLRRNNMVRANTEIS